MTYCNKKPFIPGFRIRRLAELAGGVCPANEAALLQIPATPPGPLPNGPGFGTHPCSPMPNLISPPGLRVEDRPIFTALRLCVAFW
jgi:hypothetical protein